ncbi:MAG: Coenzyme F420 hydrogenase/dehydrogenase, beta subunit C-terminal domain [Paludibacteraceae bacterium]|nr:Coenzyme F420 hydrogenase/dehydrogenase, beta subunit C-terminal domain [Paludibacteraceae bacterium]
MTKQRKIQLALHDTCTGCAACASVCPTGSISMKEDREGFLQPHIDTKTCIGCHKCEKTCPIITPIKIPTDFETQAYAAINKDEAVRMRSSSGGMFHALAKWTIEQGGVVFGARFNDQWEVVHDYTESTEGIEPFMRSKYVQSRIGDTFKQAKQFLDAGRQVLFVGTPCQIGGLKAYLKKDYDNLFAVDLICHGVSSPGVWKKHLENLQCKLNCKKIKDISFRQNINYNLTIEYLNNYNKWEVYKKDTRDDAYYSYYTRAIFRTSCYKCPFRTIYNQYADLTIGDCWNVKDDHQHMMDNKGVSAVIIHTIKAEKTFNNIQDHFIIDKEKMGIIDSRYNYAIARALNYKRNRPFHVSNFLAQYIPLAYMRIIYMHDKWSIIIKRKTIKILKHYV